MKNCKCNHGHSNGRGRRRCGCMKLARSCWENFPYYNGPCPNVEGCYAWRNCNNCNCDCDDNDDVEGDQVCDDDRCYRRGCRKCRDWEREDCDNNDGDNDDDDCDRRRRRRRRCGRRGPCSGMFMAQLPIAVAPNGIIPLVFSNPCRNDNFDVNSGLITLERGGTYLATYTVRVPETVALDTIITLNVDNAPQAGATTQIITEAGTANSEYTGQAIFQADAGDTVSLRTSEAINITETAAQPLITLTLVRLASE